MSIKIVLIITLSIFSIIHAGKPFPPVLPINTTTPPATARINHQRETVIHVQLPNAENTDPQSDHEDEESEWESDWFPEWLAE